jgi:hypothetical protein
MTGEYSTRHVALSAFLRFVLGDDHHVATMRGENGHVFYFRDDPPGRCRELADAFFSTEGAAVGNARDLLEIQFQVRKTVAMCNDSSDKCWEP